MWVTGIEDPNATTQTGTDVVVSADNSMVLAVATHTLYQPFGAPQYDYETIAYDALTGEESWDTTYDGPAHGNDTPVAIELSGDGSAVVVTGTSMGDSGDGVLREDFATLAYDTTSGAQLWLRRHNTRWYSIDEAAAMAVVPGMGRVVVTGRSEMTNSGTTTDAVTIAIAT
jgi:hypothetical protein